LNREWWVDWICGPEHRGGGLTIAYTRRGARREAIRIAELHTIEHGGHLPSCLGIRIVYIGREPEWRARERGED